MAYVLQKATATSLLTSVSAVFSSTPVAGNLMIASVTASVGVGSIAISGWSTANSIAVGLAGGLVVFYKVAGAGESTTVTATGTLATFMDIHIEEVDGIDDVSPLDKVASAADSGSGVTSRSSGTTASITQANEFVYTAVATVTDNGAGAAWTNSVTLENTTLHLITGDKSVSTVATYESTASWVNSVRAAGIAVTFLAETGVNLVQKNLPKPTTVQINWGNPITRGMIFCCPFFERGGTSFRDLVSKKLVTLSSGATWSRDDTGPAMNFDGTVNGMLSTPADGLFAPNLCSILVIVKTNMTTAGNAAFIHGRANSSQSDGGIAIKSNVASVFSAQCKDTAANQVFNLTGTSNSRDNKVHQVLVTFTVNNGDTANLFVDGKLEATTTNARAWAWRTTIAVQWGVALDSFPARYTGLQNTTIWWNRIISPREAQALYVNPWQIYKSYQ